MGVHRLSSKETIPIDEISKIPELDKGWAIGKKNIYSPEKGLTELLRFYNDNENLSSSNLMGIAIWAAYFGDPEFALEAIERSAKLQAITLCMSWSPLFHEVRQLPRFKEFVREIGLVDYWKQYG
jgi:hypothetical protein